MMIGRAFNVRGDPAYSEEGRWSGSALALGYNVSEQLMAHFVMGDLNNTEYQSCFQHVPRYLLSSFLDEAIEAVAAGLSTAVYQRPLTPRATTKKKRKGGKDLRMDILASDNHLLKKQSTGICHVCISFTNSKVESHRSYTVLIPSSLLSVWTWFMLSSHS